MSNSPHTLPRAPSAQHHKMAHPWLSALVYELLAREAERRQLHVDVLAARVLETVLRDGLLTAVLDDA